MTGDIKAGVTASAVLEINGIEASQYLDDMHKQYCQYQDRDACYNALLFSIPGISNGNYGEFQGLGDDNVAATGYVYPGANTTLLFENDTIVVWENHAVVTQDFENVIDVESFYEKFCREPAESIADEQSIVNSTDDSPARPREMISVPGYPVFIMASSDGSIHELPLWRLSIRRRRPSCSKPCSLLAYRISSCCRRLSLQ